MTRHCCTRPPNRTLAVWHKWRRCTVLLVAGGTLSFVVAPSLVICQAVQSEPSPIRENPDQQIWLRSVARENQEKHRLRVTLPSSAFVTGAARPAPVQGTASTRSKTPAEASSLPNQIGLVGILVCLAGVFISHKRLTERLDRETADGFNNSRAIESPSKLSPEALAEDKAFAEFLVAFRAGPLSQRSKPRTQTEAPPSPAPAGSSGPKGSSSSWLQHTLDMQALLQQAKDQTNESSQRQRLGELRIRLDMFAELAGFPEMLPIWQVATITEALVGQLTARPRTIGAQTLRTIADSLELLVEFGKRPPRADLSSEPPIRILAVDDDLLSRHAVGLALKKAFNQPDVAANPEAALAQASLIAYDVIFLDVMMPGMNGFELCSRIRQGFPNRLTPIVFVTGQTDSEAWVNSIAHGANDFVAKPFLTFELAVKALVLTLDGRLKRPASKSRRESRPEPETAWAAPVKV